MNYSSRRMYHPRIPGVIFTALTLKAENEAVKSGWSLSDPFPGQAIRGNASSGRAGGSEYATKADLANLALGDKLLSALELVPSAGGTLTLRVKTGAAAPQPAAPQPAAPQPAAPQPAAPQPAAPQPAAPQPAAPRPAATEQVVELHIHIPANFGKAGSRVAIVGDSHSDGKTIYGPQHMWWLRAIPEAGGLLQSGRNKVEAWAGYSVNQLIYGSAGEGRSGTGADAALSRALAKKPETVIVMSGGNDAVQASETPEVFGRRLTELHKRVSAAGAKLIYIYPPALMGSNNQAANIKEKFAELRRVALQKAQELNFAYADIWDDHPTPSPNAWDFGDRVHYTEAAHGIIGAAIAKKLKQLITPFELGNQPWGADIVDVYHGATATKVTRPASLGAGASTQAYRLESPATEAKNGYVAVQRHHDNIQPGERIDFGCTFKVDEAGADSGLELAIIDTETWSPIETFGPVRFKDFVGKGGISWTADKAYKGIRTAAVIRNNTSRTVAHVADYRFVRTPPVTDEIR